MSRCGRLLLPNGFYDLEMQRTYFCRMKWPVAFFWSASAPLWVGLVLYTLTAWRSEGYHHPDEHFQILEFANYKLGRTPVGDLPWEFEAEIRPGLQPMLAYGFIRGVEMLGVGDPFSQAFLLRLLSGWLCLLVFFRWADWLSSTSGDKRLAQWFRWITILGWFVPYLSVRFSSENWAGILFAWGLLLTLPPYSTVTSQERGWKKSAGKMGGAFLLILSFFFRFQMAFALLGFSIWLLWHWRTDRASRPSSTHIVSLFAGGVLALILGMMADVWLYDKLTFTAYNYFYVNILEDKASHWGTSPWWFYLLRTGLTAVPPLSVLLLLGLGAGLWRERRGPLVWSFVPFVLAHMAVGHKEMRFMYPMLLPALVLSVQGMFFLIKTWKPRIQTWGFARVVCWVLVVLNGALLSARSLLAAQESVPVFRFLYCYATKVKEPVAVFCRGESIYDLVGLNMRFYRSSQVQVFVVQRFEADTLRQVNTGHRLVFSPKLTLQDFPSDLHTERIFTALPGWLLRFNPNNWQRRSRMWSLHKVNL